MGAGATGGYFGARLVQAGRDATFLVRSERAARLAQRGLRITGLGERTVLRPRVIDAQDIDSPYDVILLAVKATGLEQAVDDMARAVGPGSLIVPVLNGVRHIDMLAARFGDGVVLGGVAKVATTLDAQGDIVRLADVQDLRYGARGGTSPARLREAHRVLSDAGFSTRLSAHIDSEMWSKWIFIASVGAVTCLMRGSVGEVVAVPGGAAFAKNVVEECASVAAAAGYPVPDPALRQTLASVTEEGSPLTSSLYRDVLEGRSAEVEHIFGDLVYRANLLGVAVPLLDLATMQLRLHQNRVEGARVR
ncbi:ketopantoate reductase family protein [Streptomyces olivochromogenes]|uniref:ketopantoate reductase family protein n=1 Tax=Streptomyces olivochromogenes TaxID=1963 RepID=UPI001F450611|nr:ketopantoate reductase family protein [Streptomyces olivochromogenes]